MAKFCQYCGKELNEEQYVCLNCGRKVTTNEDERKKNPGNRFGYKLSTGIIMIILGVCLVAASGSETIYESPALVFTIPGILSIFAGILSICSKENNNLLLAAGIMFLIGALSNFIGIVDISIFMILAITFGILDIIFSRK